MSTITSVDIFGYDLAYVQGRFVMSGGREIETLASTVVRLRTSSGAEGFGEVCPLGTTYLPGFSEGARVALYQMAPTLIGLDASNLNAVYDAMNRSLRGHDYAKSAVDIACWDVLGHITQQSVATLLGGVRQERFPLYAAVPLGPVEEMNEYVETRRSEGIRRFQLKLGADPQDDAERVRRIHEQSADDELIVADANGGWRLQDAVIAARLLDGLDRVFLEQPCATLEECAVVRARTTLPMILDEVVTDVHTLLRACRAQVMEALNLKISKVGGLSKARLMRDLAETLGLRLTIEDTWGGDLATAAIAHLAASTSPDATFMVSFVNDLTIGSVAGRQPHSEGGFGTAPSGAGLGVDVDLERLGKPLFSAQ